jgi:NhaA family Na+:H+ antiporter
VPTPRHTAFVIGCLALLGRRIPQSLRVFMLSLAIVDDFGAILVVAIGYSSHIAWGTLALGACGIALMWGMASFGVRSIALYFLVGGLIWLAVDGCGIHATVRPASTLARNACGSNACCSAIPVPFPLVTE